LPRKSQKFNAKVTGAGTQAARAREVKRIMEGLNQSAKRVGEDAELIYQSHAPVRSGRLLRGIRAVAVEDQVIVSAVAVDPKTGFDYVAVSRFGHKKRVIVPVTRGGRHRKSRTIKRGKGGRFVARSAGELVFTSLGRLWRLPSVRGFVPHGDWTDKAWPEVKVIADTEMKKTGNEIEVTWGS
jgi:hypothetical protein